MRRCIANGTVVTAQGEFRGDVLMEDETILAVGARLSGQADEVVDATGKYVLPGGVDQHTHFGSFGGLSFDTTAAAAVGGTTTIVDFAPQERGDTLAEAVEKHAAQARGRACVDYAFHSMVMDVRPDLPRQLTELPGRGVSAVKVFMAYKGTPYHMGDAQILQTMLAAREVGLTVMVHAEDPDIIAVETRRLLELGRTDPVNHYYARPPMAETEAVRHAVSLAKYADCPLMVMHVTTREAMEAIRAACDEGQNVFGETCTHYLALDTSFLAKPDFQGAKYVCSPPLRPREHCDALWEGIAKGWLTAVSSDHCALEGGFAAKKRGLGDFSKIPNGCPGVQWRMGMLWSQGVAQNRITREKFVELTATAPARNVGLERKGQLAPGFDADVVIYDPDYRGIFTQADSLEGLDYITFEGFPMVGRPERVYLRGQLVAERGRYVGLRGGGKRIFAKPYARAYEGFIPKRDEYLY